MADNWQLFRRRREPKEVRHGSRYINMRTCVDLHILRTLEAQLEANGSDSVLVPWISPPYGIAERYGMYERTEAEKLLKKVSKEYWGFPRVGAYFDRQWFRRRIGLVSRESHAGAVR